jgi:hypothetical protein
LILADNEEDLEMPRPAKNKKEQLVKQIKTYVKVSTKDIVAAISKDINCSEAQVIRKLLEIGLEVYLNRKIDPKKIIIQ